MSERDALIERVKRQAKLPYNRLCSEVRIHWWSDYGNRIWSLSNGKGILSGGETAIPHARTGLIFHLVFQTLVLLVMSFKDYGS